MHLELRNQRVSRNRKIVQRLMREMGLRGFQPKKKRYNSYRGEMGYRYHRIQDFGWEALPFSLLDLFNAEVIGYDVSESPDYDQIERMFAVALPRYDGNRTLLFHSDQGRQSQMER